jgi:hypothetical protein
MALSKVVYSGLNDYTVDPVRYAICKSIYLNNPVAASCRRLLLAHIMNCGPEFYWKGKPLAITPEFGSIIQSFWVPFCRDVVDEIIVAGFVPVMLVKVNGGQEIVPRVLKGTMGRDYNIMVRNTGGILTYFCVRLVSRTTGKPITPKIDRKVTILTGFGFDPSCDGKLTSIMNSIIEQDNFISKMYSYTLKAEYNRSNPQLITETQPESAGLGKDDLMYDYYGDWDKNKYKEEAKYRRNSDEIAQIVQMQMQAKREMRDEMEMAIAKQTDANIYPLPVGHKLAKQMLPQARSDWVEMNRHNEWLICAAMGVPRSLLIADVGTRNDGSARSVQEGFNDTVNQWKNHLSDILTEVYRSIADEEDRLFAIGMYDKNELLAMDESKLEELVNEPRVTVGFPMIPHETMDGLLQKYALGIISWEMFVQLSKAISGYPSALMRYDDSLTKKDPWNQEMKLSMLRSNAGSVLSALGIAGAVVFPELQNAKQDGDKKRKKSDGEKKPKKKQKKSQEKTQKEKTDDKKKQESDDQQKTEKDNVDKKRKQKSQEKKKKNKKKSDASDSE